VAEVLRGVGAGGRLVCVVGDVCLSRRKNGGRHTVVPLHASIQDRCRAIGFDNLAPIIWHKIANAQFEADGNGASFLGKPYEPNSVIKNDIEFILMQRKPGGYRAPDLPTRVLSVIAEANHKAWFQQIWSGLTGASTRRHPAPFPLELATRLVRMFSFVGDTVLDPFLGTGTTSLAASQCGRNSVGACSSSRKKPPAFEVLPAHDPPPFLVKWPTLSRPETAALGVDLARERPSGGVRQGPERRCRTPPRRTRKCRPTRSGTWSP
jgi:DNA modification methylase